MASTEHVDKISRTLETTMTQLESIWDVIGLKKEQKIQRYETICEHITELLSEMLSEEGSLLEKIKLNIKEFEGELEKLYKELHEDVPPTPELSLGDLEAKLRSDVDTLNKRRYDRLKRWRSLRKEETELSDYLVLPQLNITFEGCPSNDQLRELEQNVVMLKAERISRSSVLEKLKQDIGKLQEKLELSEHEEPELDLLKKAIDRLPKEFLDSIQQLNDKLANDFTKLMNQIEEKEKEFNGLLGRLEDQLEGEEKRCLEEVPEDNCRRKLMTLDANIMQLNHLKRQHMQKFILAVKAELEVVWDKCYFGEEQKSNCLGFYDEDYTEESLEYHENELRSIKKHYEDNKDLFKLIGRRETVWEEKMKMESEPADKHLNARGGALLKALSKKQRIEKQLPKLEKELKDKIAQWEAAQCKQLMYKDVPYLDHLELQKNEYEEQVRQKKEEKLQAKNAEMREEMHYGSKRKCVTPTATPTKYARQDTTIRSGKGNKSIMGRTLMNNTNALYRSPMRKGPLPGSTTKSSASKGEKKENTFTHSSLKKIKSGKPTSKLRKKSLGSKLCTEQSMKRRSRKSIQANRALKNRTNVTTTKTTTTTTTLTEVKGGTIKERSETSIQTSFCVQSYKDFATGVDSDVARCSSSSFVNELPHDSPTELETSI